MQSSRAARFVLAAAMASAVFGAGRLLPLRWRHWLWRWRRSFFKVWPPIGWVRLGNLRRVTPISRIFGSDRGECIDRYYIENFLARNAPDIHGSVLEIADDTYTKRFGGDRVIKSDVLHVSEGNPRASIVTDISSDDLIAANSFDCIIFTQTLQYIYDVRAAVRTLHRILKPDGILLASFPGISQISRCDMERWGDYWRFTTRSAQRLFEEVFSTGNVAVDSHGNVLAATGLLQGLVLEDLRRNELDYNDPDYQLVITVRAIKAKSSS